MSKTLVRASLKDLQMTPRKVGVVADVIRKQSVEDALVILKHTPRFASKPLFKLVDSAKHNAINNNGLSSKGLVIESIDVGPGARLKRFRAGARGRAKPYILRSSNITVVVAGSKKVKKTDDKDNKASKKAKEGSKQTKTSESEGK